MMSSDLAIRGSLLCLLVATVSCDPPSDRAFWDAVARGRFEEATELLEKGADINRRFRGQGGLTPLMVAAAKEHPTVLNYLLAHGADCNVQSRSGTTALMLAAMQGRTQNVVILLEHGADPSVVDERGHTAAEWARQRGHAGVGIILDAVANGHPRGVSRLDFPGGSSRGSA